MESKILADWSDIAPSNGGCVRMPQSFPLSDEMDIFVVPPGQLCTVVRDVLATVDFT
jgi:hypothetical protein